MTEKILPVFSALDELDAANNDLHNAIKELVERLEMVCTPCDHEKTMLVALSTEAEVEMQQMSPIALRITRMQSEVAALLQTVQNTLDKLEV